MALSSAYEICNLALAKIGHRDLLTSAEFTTPENNVVAVIASTIYEFERDLLMQSYPWRFALKRLYYDIDNFEDTITGTTAANPVVVTGTDISVANIEEDVGVYIWDTGIDDLDGAIWWANNISGETFELYYPDGITSYDGSDIGTATSGYARLAPLNGEYDYMFKLPSSCLRFYKMLYNVEYEIEGGYILTDSSEIAFSYIHNVTTVSLFPQSFIDCLVTKLAAEFAGAIADKPEMKKLQIELLERYVLPKAYQLGAMEALPKDNQQRRDPAYNTSWQNAGRG